MEGVGCAAAMCRGIGQRLDEFELLDDGARPAMRNDDRQGALVLRTNVNEVDVETIDLGDEVRHRVEPRLDLAPVVFRSPVARKLLDGRERHALREIRDRLLFGQARGKNAPPEVIELDLGRVVGEGADCVGFGSPHLQVSLVLMDGWDVRRPLRSNVWEGGRRHPLRRASTRAGAWVIGKSVSPPTTLKTSGVCLRPIMRAIAWPTRWYERAVQRYQVEP